MGQPERDHVHAGLIADLVLLDEVLDVVVHRGQHLSDEELDDVLGVTAPLQAPAE